MFTFILLNYSKPNYVLDVLKQSNIQYNQLYTNIVRFNYAENSHMGGYQTPFVFNKTFGNINLFLDSIFNKINIVLEQYGVDTDKIQTIQLSFKNVENSNYLTDLKFNANDDTHSTNKSIGRHVVTYFPFDLSTHSMLSVRTLPFLV